MTTTRPTQAALLQPYGSHNPMPGDTPAPTPSQPANSPTAQRPAQAKNVTSDGLYNPSEPLTNDRYEIMATLCASGMDQYKCWQKTSGHRVSKKMAGIRASEVFARPDVRSRLNHLRSTTPAANVPAPPQNAPKSRQRAPTSPDDLQALARRKAAEALQLSESPADIVKAVAACRELGVITSGDGPDVDPTAVLQFVCGYAGRTGDDICTELGGFRFIIDKTADVCKFPNDLTEQLRAVVDAYTSEGSL